MDLLSDLNEPQRRAVMHMDGPLLVLAGAGSGKTRVITRRVAHLIEQGVRPWNILAITFTNKAAGEMARRLEEMELPRGTWVHTFHGLCARLLREFAAEAGLSPNYTIYDASDQTKLAKFAIDRSGLPGGTFTPSKVLAAIGRAKRQLLTAEEFALKETDFHGRHMAKAYQSYEKALQAAQALDFDDLLMRLAFLMRDKPDIRRLLSERFRYILIDEYQDTNHAQYVIAHGIAMEHENICATGDPDQSIYAWRGADVHNILDFEKDYPNAVVVRLEENYRSTSPILAAASRLISHNVERKDKALFTRRPGGQDVAVITAADEHSEAAEVVRGIRQLADEGVSYRDIAVFYRLNSLSRVLEDVLRKGAVPYRIARGVEFYNRKEIKDVLAYLKLLLNHDDEVACERIINVPARGIGATTIERLRDYAMEHGMTLYRACQQVRHIAAVGKSATAKVEGFVQLIESLSKLTGGEIKTLSEAVIEQSGMETGLRSSGGEDASEWANVEELITTAAEFDEEHEKATLADYLNQVALVSDIDRFEGEEGTGAVTLMTLHAAKGLEFRAVFLVGCEQGLLPFSRPDRESDGEEERRLCFVGMTRAMDRLVLTHARYRSQRGRRERQTPSPFLFEIGSESVVRLDRNPPPAASDYRAQRPGDFFEDEPWQQREQIEKLDEFHDEEFPADSVSETTGVKPGRRVRHPMFGIGQVAKVTQAGAYTRVVVDFSQYGRKTLILQYARLELL